MSIAIADDIGTQPYTFGQANSVSVTPTITPASICARTFALFAYFETYNSWFSFESNQLDSFVDAFNSATGAASMKEDSSLCCSGTGKDTAPTTGLPWYPRTSIQLRIVVTSTYSGQQINDDFTFIMSDQCANNKLALDSTYSSNTNSADNSAAVSSFTYTIGSGDMTKLPLVSTYNAMADCPLNAYLWVLDPTTFVWID